LAHFSSTPFVSSVIQQSHITLRPTHVAIHAM
jgi:hypothetical protein